MGVRRGKRCGTNGIFFSRFLGVSGLMMMMRRRRRTLTHSGEERKPCSRCSFSVFEQHVSPDCTGVHVFKISVDIFSSSCSTWRSKVHPLPSYPPCLTSAGCSPCLHRGGFYRYELVTLLPLLVAPCEVKPVLKRHELEAVVS